MRHRIGRMRSAGVWAAALAMPLLTMCSSVPQPQVQLPPPPSESSQEPIPVPSQDEAGPVSSQPAYHYEHENRGISSEQKKELRAYFRVAVARVTDNSKVDTPFGTLAWQGLTGSIVAVNTDGEVKKIDIGLDADSSPLVREEVPSGFDLGTRTALVNLLHDSRCFTVIERESINDIVREIDFGEGDYVDPDDRSVKGRLKGVRFIVKGGLELNPRLIEGMTAQNWDDILSARSTPSRMDKRFRFHIRMYSVETGIVAAVGTGYGDTPSEALEDSVRELSRTSARWYREQEAQ